MRSKLFPLIKICCSRTDPAAETKSIGLQADARVVSKILRTLLSANIIFCLVMILHSCKDYDDSIGAIPTFDPLVNNITQTEADIRGIVFRATSVYLEYGVDTTYGNTISCGTFTFRYESNVGHSHLTNLNPNTTYHCRGVAKNKHSTNYSPDLTFTTLP